MELNSSGMNELRKQKLSKLLDSVEHSNIES
jgi:hypothetical protein